MTTQEKNIRLLETAIRKGILNHWEKNDVVRAYVVKDDNVTGLLSEFNTKGFTADSIYFDMKTGKMHFENLRGYNSRNLGFKSFDGDEVLMKKEARKVTIEFINQQFKA